MIRLFPELQGRQQEEQESVLVGVLKLLHVLALGLVDPAPGRDRLFIPTRHRGGWFRPLPSLASMIFEVFSNLN